METLSSWIFSPTTPASEEPSGPPSSTFQRWVIEPLTAAYLYITDLVSRAFAYIANLFASLTSCIPFFQNESAEPPKYEPLLPPAEVTPIPSPATTTPFPSPVPSIATTPTTTTPAPSTSTTPSASPIPLPQSPLEFSVDDLSHLPFFNEDVAPSPIPFVDFQPIEEDCEAQIDPEETRQSPSSKSSSPPPAEPAASDSSSPSGHSEALRAPTPEPLTPAEIKESCERQARAIREKIDALMGNPIPKTDFAKNKSLYDQRESLTAVLDIYFKRENFDEDFFNFINTELSESMILALISKIKFGIPYTPTTSDPEMYQFLVHLLTFFYSSLNFTEFLPILKTFLELGKKTEAKGDVKVAEFVVRRFASLDNVETCTVDELVEKFSHAFLKALACPITDLIVYFLNSTANNGQLESLFATIDSMNAIASELNLEATEEEESIMMEFLSMFRGKPSEFLKNWYKESLEEEIEMRTSKLKEKANKDLQGYAYERGQLKTALYYAEWDLKFNKGDFFYQARVEKIQEARVEKIQERLAENDRCTEEVKKRSSQEAIEEKGDALRNEWQTKLNRVLNFLPPELSIEALETLANKSPKLVHMITVHVISFLVFDLAKQRNIHPRTVFDIFYRGKGDIQQERQLIRELAGPEALEPRPSAAARVSNHLSNFFGLAQEIEAPTPPPKPQSTHFPPYQADEDLLTFTNTFNNALQGNVEDLDYLENFFKAFN